MKRIYLLYIPLLFLLTLFSFAFVDKNLSYLHFLYSGFATDKRPIVTAIYILLLTLFFFFYIYVLKRSERLSIATIRNLIIFSVAILLLSYPAMLSADIFNYITTAKVIFFITKTHILLCQLSF